jgi:hypothetical protein
MKKLSLFLVIILVLSLFASCADKVRNLAEDKAFDSRAEYAGEMPSSTVRSKSSLQASPENEVITRNRKIIRTAHLTIYVEKFDSASGQIESVARQFGGVVANKSSSQHPTSVSGNFTLWVPAENLMTFVTEVKKIGNVTSENINAEDISDRYFDLEARLSNSKKQEVRLLELLQKTGSLNEVLEVERELARIRESIELMEGNKRQWDQMVSYSTVNVNVIQDAYIAKEPVNMWKPLRDSLRNLKPVFLSSIESIIKFVAFILIAIAALLPWVIFILILKWIWGKMFGKRWQVYRARKREEKQMKEFHKEQQQNETGEQEA